MVLLKIPKIKISNMSTFSSLSSKEEPKRQYDLSVTQPITQKITGMQTTTPEQTTYSPLKSLKSVGKVASAIIRSPMEFKAGREKFTEATPAAVSAGQRSLGILTQKIGESSAKVAEALNLPGQLVEYITKGKYQAPKLDPIVFNSISKTLEEKSEKNLELSRVLQQSGIQIQDTKTFNEKIQDPKFIAEGLGGNLPNLLMSLGVAGAGTVAGGPVVGAVAGFGSGAFLEGGYAYNEAKSFLENSEDPAQRALANDKDYLEKIAVQVGLVNGLLEVAPITKLLNRNPLGNQIKKRIFTKIMNRILTQAGIEGGTESIQEIVSNVVAQEYDKERETFQGVGEAGFFGALMGGGISTVADLPTITKDIKPGLTIEDVSKQFKSEKEFMEKGAKPFHSIKLDDLKTIEQAGGGIPSPSIGISKNIESIEGYGDITLIPSDKMLGETDFYTRDIWSPTIRNNVPETIYIPNRNVIYKELKPIVEQSGFDLDVILKEAIQTDNPYHHLDLYLTNDQNIISSLEELAKKHKIIPKGYDVEKGYTDIIANKLLNKLDKNADNISKYLSEAFAGEDIKGVGSIFGGSQKAAQQFSFSDISKYEKQLSEKTLDTEQLFLQQIKANDSLNKLLKRNISDTGAGELASNDFIGFKRGLLEDYGVDVSKFSDSKLQKVWQELRKAYVDIPTDYFEGKKFQTYSINDFPTIITKNKEAIALLEKMNYQGKILSSYADIWKEANKTADLTTQAKGKSLEEFMEGQGTPVYHGSSEVISGDFRTPLYLSENKAYADTYQHTGASSMGRVKKGGGEKTYEFYKAPKERILDVRNPKHMALMEDYFANESVSGAFYPSKRGLVDWTDAEGISQYVENKKLPFDALLIDEGGIPDPFSNKTIDRGIGYVALNKNGIKTKSELTSIWKEANKSDIVREKYVSKTEGTNDYTVREPKDLYNSPVAIKYKKQGFVTFANQKISEPADVAFAFKELKNEAVEKFYAVGLKGNEPVTVECVSMGTLNASMVHPRETFGLLLKNKIDGVYFVHNHPSGDIQPSEDDLMITRRLTDVAKNFGIDFKGHIIIDSNKFGFIDKSTPGDYSKSFIKEITHHDKAIDPKKISLYTKYAEWTADKPTDFVISKPDEAYELIKGLNLDKKNNALVLHLNTRNVVITAQAVSKKSIKHNEIFEQATKFQSANIIMVNTGLKGNEVVELSKKFKLYGVDLLDVIEQSPIGGNYRSMNAQGYIREDVSKYGAKGGTHKMFKPVSKPKAPAVSFTKLDEPQTGTILEMAQNDFERAESEVFTLLELSTAGERLFGEYGQFERSIFSSFPDFISPELRSKKLFDIVVSRMTKGEELRGTKQIQLKNEIEKAILNRMEPTLSTEKQVNDLIVKLETEKETKTNKFLKEIEQGIIDKLTKKRFSLLQMEKIKSKAKINKEAKIKQLESEFQMSKGKAVRKEQLKTTRVGITERIKGIAKGVRESRVLTKSEIEANQTEIIDILDKSNLEKNDKAKFIRAIKNVQTKEQLEKALPVIQDRIETLTEKASKRTLKSKIKKELENTKIRKQAGKPIGKFTPEVQKNLNLLRDASRLTKSEADVVLFKNLALFKDKIPPESIALENKILTMMAGMDEMRVEELQNALKQIQTIKETGKLTAELKKFNRQADIDMWVDKAVDIISGGKGLPKNISTIGTQEVRPELLKERIKKFMGTLGKDLVGWNDIVDMLARKTKAKPGTTFLDDFADVTDQENAVKKGHRINLGGDGKARKITEEAFGLKKDREIVKLFQEDAKETSLGIFEDMQGEMSEIIYTKAEARKAWMELQDPTLKETFTEGMFYTDEIINAIDDFLTPQDKAFAQKQLDFYKEYYNGVNEIYRDIYGVDLPNNEFYSPIRRVGIDREESAGFGEFLQEISIRKSVTSGSLKSRVSNIKPLKKQSDVATLEQHIAEMEHFKAWAHKIRDLNAVFGNTQVRATIIREHGNSMLGMVDNFIGDFTRGGIELASRLGWLDKIRGNFSRAILAIKPSIGVKQLTSFIAYADSIPVKDFTTGTISFWQNPVDRIKILRQSEMMKARSQHMERDIKTAVRSDAYSSFRKHPSFLNSLMLNIQVGDQGAIYAGGWSVYKYYLPKLGHKGALKKFEQITSTTQQSADLSKLSYWQRGGSFAKLFTMFKSAPNQFFRKELGAVRNKIHGRIPTSQLVKTIAIYHFILPMLFQFVSDWFNWDPEEQKRAAIMGPFNGIFIVGDMFDTMIRYAMGMKVFDSELPIYSIADDYGKTLKLISDNDITTEDMFNAVRGFAGATGGLTGIPLKQPIDMSEGVKDILDGEFEQGLAKVLGWSPYIAEKEKKKKPSEKIQITPQVKIPQIKVPKIKIPSIKIPQL